MRYLSRGLWEGEVMSQSDDPLALLLTQSDIPPEICAHLMLVLHQTLACTIELRSRVEQIP
jgi:hypothetical protein